MSHSASLWLVISSIFISIVVPYFIIILRCIEYIGMRNMKDTTGMYLKEIFKDPVRAANMRYIAFSGSKEVSHKEDILSNY